MASIYPTTRAALLTQEVRIYAGPPFTNVEQQNAQEFLNRLITGSEMTEGSPVLKQMTQFTELKVTVCNSCNHQFTIKSHGHMLQVPIVESEKNINRMLNHLLAQSTTPDLWCSNCRKESYREQIQIKNPSNFLILLCSYGEKELISNWSRTPIFN